MPSNISSKDKSYLTDFLRILEGLVSTESRKFINIHDRTLVHRNVLNECIGILFLILKSPVLKVNFGV